MFCAFGLLHCKIPKSPVLGVNLSAFASIYQCLYLFIYLFIQRERKERERNTGNKAEKIPLIINDHCIPRFQTRIKNYVKQMINFRWAYFLNFSFIIILQNLTLNNCIFQIVIYLLIRNRCRSGCPKPSRGVLQKSCSQKFLKIQRKTPVPEFLF